MVIKKVNSMNTTQIYIATKGLGGANYKKGRILNENNKPYVDVHVLNTTQNIATITDKNGEYEINYNPNDIIEISHVSFGKLTYPAEFLPNVLEVADSNKLSEVVLVSRTKKNNTKNILKKYIKPVAVSVVVIATIATGIIIYNKNKTVEVNG